MRQIGKYFGITFVGVCCGWISFSFATDSTANTRKDRFQIIQMDTKDTRAYLQVDRKTGVLSLCQKQGAVWQCELIPDKESVEQEIATLNQRIITLEQGHSAASYRVFLQAPQQMGHTAFDKLFRLVSGIKQKMGRSRK